MVSYSQLVLDITVEVMSERSVAFSHLSNFLATDILSSTNP